MSYEARSAAPIMTRALATLRAHEAETRPDGKRRLSKQERNARDIATGKTIAGGSPRIRPRSQPWDADTRAPIFVNETPALDAYASGGGVDDDPFADLMPDTAPAPVAAASAAPADDDPFADLMPETAAPATLSEASEVTPPADAAPLGWLKYAEGVAQKAAQGVTLGFGDELAAGIGSLVGKRSYDEILAEIRGREKEFETAHPNVALGSEIVGSVALPLGTGATATRALARVPGWIGRPGYARSALGAGATAAPFGAVAEVGKSEGDKSIGELGDLALEGGKTAAMYGAGFGAAGHGLARVVGPWASAAAQRLHDQNIRLTPGQLIGPNAKRIEDALTSLPGANIMVRGRREEAIEDLNRVAINRALEPIGGRLPDDIDMGHDAVALAGDEISAVYQRAVPRMEGLRDTGLEQQLQHLSNDLPMEQSHTFVNYVARELNNVTNQTSPARISGEDMQHLIGDFRTEGQRLTANVNASHHDRELGRAFTHAADEIETNLLTHSPPDAVDEFMAANRAFAQLVRVESAAKMSDEGIFTPAQLKNAIRTSDRSSRKRNVARGDALMQDLGSDAKVVIGNTLNDSGTPERAMTNTLLGTGAAGMFNPMLMLAPAGLAALYSGPVNRAFQAAAAGRAGPRQRAREYLERITRAGAPAVGIAATTEN